MKRPLIGITPDVSEPESGKVRAIGAMAYQQAVQRAGGLPLMLAPIPDLAPQYVAMLNGIVLTGGGDVRMELLGGVTHSCAAPMHPVRQEFEFALLRAIDARPSIPVLGICLGMQLMSLHRGGELNQHMPDTLATADRHRADHHHAVNPVLEGVQHPLPPGRAASNHHQSMVSVGGLTVSARSEDGVIEAVEDPARPFYLGVQWHPERTTDNGLGACLFERLVAAARKAPGLTIT